MEYLKKLISAVLILSMVSAFVPATASAAGGRWSVAYDASAYEEGTLSVILFDAKADATVRAEWTDTGSSIRADVSADGLFERGGEYYAVVSYAPKESGGSGSGSGGSGGSFNLTDEQIEAEFDLYYVAASGKAIPTLGVPDEDATAEELFAWYGELLELDDFWIWNDDEDEGWWLDKLSVAELRAIVDDWYDPDCESYDETAADVVSEYVNAYMDYTQPYFNYDLSSKRSLIEMYIRFPEYAPPGYTPPSASGGGIGGGTSSDADKAPRSVLRRLSESDMASGFTVGEDYFDACVPLEVTPVYIGQAYDPVTFMPIDGYSEVRAYFVADGHTIPALPEKEEPDDEEEYGFWGDPESLGTDVSAFGDPCGAIPAGSPLYVPQGEMLVTTAANASSEAMSGTEIEPFVDWERVTIGRSGAKVDFTTGRRFVTLTAAEDGLDDDFTTSLTVYLTGGELGSAAVSSQVVSFDLDTETYSLFYRVRGLKVKPGDYGITRLVVVGGDLYESKVMFWEKEIGAIRSSVSLTVPSRSLGADAYTAELVFTSLETGEHGPFAEGESVRGDLLLTVGDYRLVGMAQVSEEEIAFMTTDAVFGDGVSVTPTDLNTVPYFTFSAPSASKEMTATATFEAASSVEFTASATAVVPVGGGIVPEAPTGFSASAENNEIAFSWDALSFDGLTGFTVYKTDADGWNRVPVATAANNATGVSVPIDRASWGQSPWYFTLTASAGGTESPDAGPVRVSDPLAPFRGAGSYEAADASVGGGASTITEGKNGALSLTFTPDADVTADVSSVAAALKYTDISGAAKQATATLAKAGGYRASLDVPGDAAVLLSVTFTCRVDGASLTLDTIDLGELEVVSTYRLVLPTADYPLSASFDRATAKYGRDAFSFTLSEDVLKGVVARSVLSKAKVSFFIGSEPFSVAGALSDFVRDGDEIFVTASSLPDKIRLTATAENCDLTLSCSAFSINALFVDHPTVTAAASSGGVSTFFIERAAGARGDITVKLLPLDPALSFIPYEGADIVSEDGFTFVPGADLFARGTIEVEGLGDDFAYVSVVSAEDGSTPSGDVIIELENGRYTTWYHSTGQLDLRGLRTGEVHTLRIVGSTDVDITGDPVVFTVPENGAGPDGLPTLTYVRSVTLDLDVLLFTDELGTGSSAHRSGLTADFDVYYWDRVAGEWTLIPGTILKYTTGGAYGQNGIALGFRADAGIHYPRVDVDRGLKLVFGTDARLIENSSLASSRYDYEGERAKLVSGQVFYTVPCDENGGITASGLSSQIRTAQSGKGNVRWIIGAIEDSDGAFIPVEIKGLRVADKPRVELRTGRAVEPDTLTYVFRNTADGTLRSQSFELLYRNDGAILSYDIDDLPYGEYDMLMYVGTGEIQAQLERQFASGGAVSVPATVCGAIVRGVTLTETDAAVRLDLPAAPVSNAPGIQSITVTPDKDAALAGERVTFAVHLACVPGGTLTERTLDFNTIGSRFEIDSVSASLRDGNGRAVTPTVNGTDDLVIPENTSTVSGVVMVSGKVSTGGSGISAHLDVERGSVDHSKYNYCRGVCTVETFSFSVRKTTLRPTAAASGRGAGNSDITATVTSERDPGRTLTQTIPVSRYGYWKAMIEYPTDSSSDTFTVVFRDADGNLLGEGRTEYVSSGVIPSKISIAWIFNDNRCEVTGYPDEAGSFPALDSAILTFDSGFDSTGVCVEIEFDDENADGYGLTDARRVRDPYLSVTPENGRFSYEYDFIALDEKTFDLNIPELGIDEKDIPYSTRYYTVYNAANYGAMSVDYDLTPVYEATLPDDGAASFSGTAAEAAEFREFSHAVAALEEPYVGVGTLECDFAEYNFEGLSLSDIEGAYDPLTDEDAPVILPYSGEAHFTIENEIEIKPVASPDTAAAIAELSEKSGTLSRSFGGGSFIKYAGADEKAYVVLNEDGTADIVLETTWSALVDVSAITESGPTSDAPVLRAVRSAATRAGGGDGGIFSVSQSTKETVGGVMLDIATNAPEKLIDSGHLLAKNASAAKIAKGFAEGFGTVLNVASVGMTAALERKEDKKAESEMEKLIAELKGNLDKSLAYYNSKLTCYKGGAGAVRSALASIRKMADFDFAEVLSNSKISNKALAGFNIAVSATGFIPVPFAGTVIGAINDKNKDLARDNQKFFDDTAAWQAYYKAETAMRKAYGKYDPDACEEQKPDPVDLTDWLKERSKNYSLVDPAPVKVRPKRIIDPSGTVYEGLLSNPLAGVTVSIEYLDGGEWKLWEEAPEYNDQSAEYVTDASGFYRWDVPDGKWRVRYFKEGYNGGEPVYSDEMDVPPVWLDVNQNMISTDPFGVSSTLTENGLRIEFTKPVRASDIENGLITLECDGEALADVVFVPDGVEEGLTMAATAEVRLDRNSEYKVRVNGVTTYAGTVCAFSSDVDVSAAPERFVCATVVASAENGSRVPYGTGITLTCETEGVKIYYTLNGDCPCDTESPARTLYTGPVVITEDVTLRAYAVRGGYEDGKVAKFAFFCDPPLPSFTDVPSDAYYAAPVAWAVANDITKGTSATTFSPDEGCTRGQVVTFLWRAAGHPEPTGSSNPFKDVKSDDYFYKAVLWAVENGITAGTSKTTFSPNDVCTRGQIVTFLWRSKGEPKPKSSGNPFKDVKTDDYFCNAVLWAVEKGITLGTDAKHFSPSDTCTRGQVVTFLYRAQS